MLGSFIDTVSSGDKKKDDNWKANRKKVTLVGKFASEQPTDLEPVDPSTGIILSQGHIVFHLVYFIMINYFVEFEREDGHTCFEYSEEEGDYTIIPTRTPKINKAVNAVKWIHLLCFLCLAFCENFIKERVSSAFYVTRILIGFFTVPLYIFSILWLMSVDDAWRFKFTPDSTMDNYKAMGDFCINMNGGNVREWAQIEIATFYMVMATLILSLFIARITHRDPEDKMKEQISSQNPKSLKEPLMQNV